MGPPLLLASILSLSRIGGALGGTAEGRANPQHYANLEFNLTFTPVDAVFDPNPSLDPTSKYQGEWMYTVNPVDPSVGNYLGVAASSAVASCSGNGTSIPQLTLDFPGTAYYLFGKSPAGATNDDREIVVDGTAATLGAPTSDFIGSVTNLDRKLHSTRFSPSKGSPWQVSSLEVTTGMDSEAQRFDDAVISEVSFLSENALNGWFRWTGNWTALSALPHPAGKQETVPYSHAFGSNGSTVEFDIPSGTAFIVVNGTIGPDHNLLNITISSNGTSPMTGTANASRPFRGSGVVGFFRLSSEANYTARIQTWAHKTPSGDWLPWDRTSGGLGGVTFYSTGSNADPTSPSSPKLSTGGIVGAAVGGSVGLLLLLLLVYGLFYLRKKKARKATRPLSFDVGSHHTARDPFIQQSVSSGDSGTNTWYNTAFPAPPQHSPPYRPRRSLDQVTALSCPSAESHPFLGGPSGESIQRLMSSPEKSRTSLNHYPASPASTYPAIHEPQIINDFGVESHGGVESLAGANTAGSRLSVMNPDPSPRFSTEGQPESHPLMQGYSDNQFTSAITHPTNGRTWMDLRAPGEPTIRE